jgi:DNA-binding response OmpR family regulator
LRAEPADLAVIDLGLPGMGGRDLIARLAQKGQVAMVAVTREGEAEQRIAALEAGADDYVVKPYHPGELVARVRAVLRRRRIQVAMKVSLAGWVFDLDAKAVWPAGAGGESRSVPLTRGEFALLEQLIEADGKIVSRERLSETVARDAQNADIRSVDTLVSRLRRKLPSEDSAVENLIVTVPGFGYRLAGPCGQVER